MQAAMRLAGIEEAVMARLQMAGDDTSVVPHGKMSGKDDFDIRISLHL
jgi:hypothetical protein